MIELSNGHRMRFVASSGSLAFDGRGYPWEWPLRWTNQLDPRLFTIVIKTLLPDKWPGNLRWHKPWDVVKFITVTGEEIHPLKALVSPGLIGGVVNAIGLTGGPGFDDWLGKYYYPVIERRDYKVIISITEAGGQVKGCLRMARRLSDLKNVVGIEYNPSCPNTDLVLLNDPDLAVRNCFSIKEAVPDLPFLIKLSYAQPYLQIAKALEGVVEAVSINTIPWKAVFGDIPSPLAKYGGGGVSGPVAKPKIRLMIEELVKETKIPVIGAGVWEYDDIERLRSFGASAIQLGTIFIRWPWKPTQFVRRWQKEQEAFYQDR